MKPDNRQLMLYINYTPVFKKIEKKLNFIRKKCPIVKNHAN